MSIEHFNIFLSLNISNGALTESLWQMSGITQVIHSYEEFIENESTDEFISNDCTETRINIEHLKDAKRFRKQRNQLKSVSM